MSKIYPCGEEAWRENMRRILDRGEPVAPRGQPTLEILHTNSIRCAMGTAVVTCEARKLNYRFMAAEAIWVISGDNRLEPLTRYVKRMADFSDDGLTLSGAYGPPVVDQLGYVVRALLADRDTRQAVLTTWRPRPGPSKDIPCTISMCFSIRADQLHQHVYMRSSDAWLGIPYDLFTFSCVGLKVACEYNRLRPVGAAPVTPGSLTISPTSSHLYDRDREAAERILGDELYRSALPVSYAPVEAGRWDVLDDALVRVRDGAGEVPWPIEMPMFTKGDER